MMVMMVVEVLVVVGEEKETAILIRKKSLFESNAS
jgi:hypothetical protein